MPPSVSISQVTAYQAFVRKFGREILTKAHLDFTTAKHVKLLPGNKGTITLTKMVPDGAVIRGFDGVFQGYQSQRLLPIEYKVNDFKSEFLIKPWELRYSYLGEMQKAGFDPVDLPIQRMFFNQHTALMAEEMEITIWEGVRNPAAAADAPIISKMDGFGVRINQAITAGNVPVVTGAITTTNIVDQLRAMYDKVDKRYKGRKITCFLSINHQQSYRIKRGETLKETTDTWTMDRFNTGNMDLVFVGGLDDNKIVMTIPDNFTYTYDGEGDDNMWYLDRGHYHIEGSVTMAAGTQIDWMDTGLLIVNDQW